MLTYKLSLFLFIILISSPILKSHDIEELLPILLFFIFVHGSLNLVRLYFAKSQRGSNFWFLLSPTFISIRIKSFYTMFQIIYPAKIHENFFVKLFTLEYHSSIKIIDNFVSRSLDNLNELTRFFFSFFFNQEIEINKLYC